MRNSPISIRTLALAATSLFLCAGPVMAASASAEAQARYRQDMAVCNSGQSNQDQATCRLEARNALAESRRGGLTDPAGAMQQNMLMRCSAHKGDDRSACEARVGAQGSMQGSVSAGGILRQSVVTVPAN